MFKIKPYSNRIDELEEFKRVYLDYIKLEAKGNVSAIELEKYKEYRESLNRMMGFVRSHILNSGTPTSVHYSPPPAVGGLAGEIDFFSNLFQLEKFSIPTMAVTDCIDRAIGKYIYLNRVALRRWLNPFYWIGELIRAPFKLLGFSGFNSAKIEDSFLGKLYKFVVSFSGLVASFIAIYYFLLNIGFI